MRLFSNQFDQTLRYYCILGNGANFSFLEQASIESCDIFISMTEHDEVNMVSEKQRKWGAKETVNRVRNPGIFQSFL